MNEQHPNRVTQLLTRLESGDGKAAQELFPLVYDQLRAIAGKVMQGRGGQTLQPTAMVHEAYLKLGGDASFRDSEHFVAVCARAMRSVLTDAARRRSALKRGGDRHRVTIEGIGTAGADLDLIAVDEALNDLASIDERQARIVELRFFGAMTMERIAHHLGVSLSTVEADWRLARAWLSAHLAGESLE
ncbi:MAG: sigma-70 family RNA polymerase sigma factor [Phycisphaerales bacterium]|nr:sigma-70 family RNA polymerase sigma factor [Phycisphaerales bacterium]